MDATQKNHDYACPLGKKLEDLYKLIDGIQVCMLTSRREDGYLVSRPMGTQSHMDGVDLWFVTNTASHKLDELNFDPHVNLAYYKNHTGDWVSVSGTAKICYDRARVRQLYSPTWKAWFGDLGDGIHTGGPEDPRIALIVVEAHSVTYSKTDHIMPVVYFEIFKGMITGETPKIASIRELNESELRHSQAAQH